MTRTRRAAQPDLYAATLDGVVDLWTASLDDVELEAGRLYRETVARGGTCPCGAHVASWPWAERLAGVPPPVPRYVPHEDACPARLPGTAPILTNDRRTR